MIDLNKVKLENIIDDNVLLLSAGDIVFYCDDEDLTRQIKELIQDINEKFGNGQERIKELLVKNEDKIYKENFILCLINNYNAHLNNTCKKIDGEITELIKLITNNKSIGITQKELDELFDVIGTCIKKDEVFDKVVKTYINQQRRRMLNIDKQKSKEIKGYIKEIYKYKKDYRKNKEFDDNIQTEVLEAVNKIINSLTNNYSGKITKSELPKYINAIYNSQNESQITEEIVREYLKQQTNKLVETIIDLQNSRNKDIKDLRDSLYFDSILAKAVIEDNKSLLPYMKGRDLNLYTYYYDKKAKRYSIDIISSKELTGDNKDADTNIKRVNEIDESFREGKKGHNGIEYILQAIVLSDFEEIFNDERFGQAFRKMVLENIALKKGFLPEEIIRMNKENPDEYYEKIEKIDFDIFCVEAIADAVREYADKVDTDKLLLIGGYRFYEALENHKIEDNNIIHVKMILENILKNIKNNGMKLSCELEFLNADKSDWESRHVEFSKQKLEECIQKFTDSTYITEEQINKYKQKIESLEIDFSQINSKIIDIVFSQEEQERYSSLSDVNFLTMARKNNWDSEKIKQVLKQKGECSANLLRELLEYRNLNEEDIMQIYLDEIIDIKALYNILETVELDKSKLLEYYKKGFLENNTKEELEKNQKIFKQYSALFKQEILNREEEQCQEIQIDLLSEIYNTIKDEEDRIKAIAYFYKNELIEFKTVIGVSDKKDKILNKFINYDAMTMDEIISAFNGKSFGISAEEIKDAMLQYIYKGNLTYEESFQYISSGFISVKKDIMDLYEKGYITLEDLLELARKNIIDQRIADLALRELEKNSKVVITGLNYIKKINFDLDLDIYDDLPYGGTFITKKQCIDPEARDKFIKLFDAVYADTDIIDEDNPFYNYQFYVIPEKDGYYGTNSIVIAERYFEDKETKKGYATDNATYVMRYGDLELLNQTDENKVAKKDRVKCYRVIHNMKNEDEDREGSWAREVMRAVVQARLNSDLSEYKSYNEKRDVIINTLLDMYGHEQVVEIIKFAESIDFGGMFDCEITPTGALRRKNQTQADDFEDIEF